MKILLLLALFAADASANTFDDSVRNSLKWEDTKTPGKVSDYAVGTLVVSSIAIQKTWEQRGVVAGAHLAGAAINQLVKKSVGRMRPDGSESVSFYSGHTSSSFLSAAAICLRESGAICAASLLAAGSVGYLRIAADKHWATDVIVGAGVGYTFGHFVPTIVVDF